MSNAKRTAATVTDPAPPERPAYLVRLDGLCRPCADATHYGLRMEHANCLHGDCACTYVIPEQWPAGTWPVKLREPATA